MPNLAAVQALAEPGWVVIAEAIQLLIAGLSVAVGLGDRQLKGFAVSLRSGRIIGEAKAKLFRGAAAVLGPLVGWAAELASLLELWHQGTSGQGQAVLSPARRDRQVALDGSNQAELSVGSSLLVGPGESIYVNAGQLLS